MKRRTMFVLRAHELDTQEHCDSKPLIKKDLTVDLTNHELGIFSTREKAEKMIGEWLKHIKDWNWLILGFTITEKIVDGSFTGDFNEISEFEAKWAYDGKGQFLCDSLYDDACTVPFRGREVQVKAKIGDIAFVRYGRSAVPVLVTDLPPSREWWKTHIKGDHPGDCTDDSYTTVQWQSGHEHPNSTRVFPFIGTPTKAIEQKLWAEFKRYVKDCGLPKSCIPADRHQLKEGWWKVKETEKK